MGHGLCAGIGKAVLVLGVALSTCPALSALGLLNAADPLTNASSTLQERGRGFLFVTRTGQIGTVAVK